VLSLKLIEELQRNKNIEIENRKLETNYIHHMSDMWKKLSPEERDGIIMEQWIIQKVLTGDFYNWSTDEDHPRLPFCRICFRDLDEHYLCPECEEKSQWLDELMKKEPNVHSHFLNLEKEHYKLLSSIRLPHYDDIKPAKQILKNAGKNMFLKPAEPIKYMGEGISHLAKGNKEEAKRHFRNPITKEIYEFKKMLNIDTEIPMSLFNIELLLTPKERLILEYAPPQEQWGDDVIKRAKKLSQPLFIVSLILMAAFFLIMLLI
jgi:hypothetical protein